MEKPWKTTWKTPVEKAETEGKMKMQKLNENEAPQKLILKNDNTLSLSLSLIVIESQMEKPWKTTRKTPVENAETEGKRKKQKLKENEAPQKLCQERMKM